MDFSLNPVARKIGSIFQRIAAGDRTAIKDCVISHGNFVWALARNLTDSSEAAEILAREIFKDIWKCAEHFDSAKCDECAFIQLIARRKSRKLTASISN